MLKSLFATCLTALSVNTQPLAVSPSIEPSRAITEDTDFNVGDIVRLDYSVSFGNEDLIYDLVDNGDNCLRLVSYSISNSDIHVFLNFVTDTYVFYSSYFVTQISSVQDFEIFYGIDINDSEFIVILQGYSNFPTFDISFTFEILEGFSGFFVSSYPYLTKVENPYTPPAKSNLYRLLYDFYYSIFNDDDLTAITNTYNMPFDNWLAHTCTIATLITLIVVAFFFLRWLFKVISGLILLKR